MSLRYDVRIIKRSGSMKKRFLGLIILCILIGAVIGLVKLNKWIQSQVGDIAEESAPAVITESHPVEKMEAPPIKKRHGDVIRRTRLAPERTFETSIFYQGGEEIARHKVTRKGMIYDQTGEIPNGKVKFINETDQTYGVEYYRNGARNGPARVNYRGGSLKLEANYQYGKLMTKKEYFHDGALKMTEDYTDAREYDDDREVGIGKVYTRDGRVKYEWFIINSDPIGYHKFYDSKGRLTATVYYDQDGNLVQPKTGVTGSNAPLEAGL